MINLKAFGPFEIKRTKNKHSYIINKDNVKEFWKLYGKYSKKKGIYIFVTRAGLGYTPWYIGKTKNSFYGECFQPGKMLKYNDALSKKAGTPMMFFICKTGNKNVINQNVLSQIEEFFIQQGSSKNKNLLNIVGKPKYRWAIKGVFNSAKGNPEIAARELNSCMGF